MTEPTEMDAECSWLDPRLRLGLCGVVFLAALWLPTSAGAHTMIAPPPAPSWPYQQWVDESLVPTPDETVAVIEEDCETAPACTSEGGPILFGAATMAEYGWTEAQVRRTFLHELGHQFSYVDLSTAEREAFGRLIGDLRPWAAEEANAPNEKFGEAFSLCARLRSLPRKRVTIGYGYSVTKAQHRQICRAIRLDYWTP